MQVASHPFFGDDDMRSSAGTPAPQTLGWLFFGVLLATGAAVSIPPWTLLADEPGTNSADETPKPAKTQEQLEKDLAAKLTGSVFVGQFTVTGKEQAGGAAERYTITGATKLAGDDWMITSRIEYGKHDVTVPMIIPILWAGDTPVMTVQDLTIPGLGTFSSRVLIHGDRYAGTWQHGEVGGHMFGRIEPAGEKPPEKPGDESPKGKEKKDK
jgi:hypothetical protein